MVVEFIELNRDPPRKITRTAVRIETVEKITAMQSGATEMLGNWGRMYVAESFSEVLNAINGRTAPPDPAGAWPLHRRRVVERWEQGHFKWGE